MIFRSLFIIALLSVSTQAQSLVNIAIGPIWPSKIAVSNPENKTAWNGTFEYGKVFAKKIVLGGKIDFTWDVARIESPTNSDSIIAKSELFMFPVSVFLQLDPFSKYRLHPVGRVQFGFNSMVIRNSYNTTTDQPNAITYPQGYYAGVITKVGADLVFDIGKHGSIFGGAEYQFSKVNREHLRLNMNAPAIRLGISIYY